MRSRPRQTARRSRRWDERSAKAIEAGHEAIKDIDQLIARLHQVRAQLVSELRQDEDIRAARVDALLARAPRTVPGERRHRRAGAGAARTYLEAFPS